MRIIPGTEQLRVASLTELDALVGELVMHEHPSVYWEDAAARHRFNSLDEAMDVLHDPILQDFLSADRCASPMLKIREFRRYATTMMAAWDVVERLAAEPFQLRKEGREWVASFGLSEAVSIESAAVAICLAALRYRGYAVQLDLPKGVGR